MSLGEKLLEIKANAAQYVRPESQAITDRTIAWLNSSAAVGKALKVGQRAPAFTLTGSDGRSISSDQVLKTSPAVIVFFRGRWCPYCVAQLEALRELQPKFAQASISLWAVSPQTLRQIDFMREQHGLNFSLVRDERNRAAQAFGVAYEVPAEQQELYRTSL
jgi:peroxiredoxin